MVGGDYRLHLGQDGALLNKVSTSRDYRKALPPASRSRCLEVSFTGLHLLCFSECSFLVACVCSGRAIVRRTLLRGGLRDGIALICSFEIYVPFSFPFKYATIHSVLFTDLSLLKYLCSIVIHLV